MKILQVNNVYGKGSTGKIAEAIHNALLCNGHESIVLYGRGNKSNDKKAFKLCSNLYAKINKAISLITGMMYGGCFFSTNRAIKIIKKEKPDIVHIQCINGNFINIYRIIAWLKKNKIKTIITLHAEFMHTANCAHSYDCEKWKSGCGNCPRLKAQTGSFFIDATHRSWLKMKKSFNGFDSVTIVPVSNWISKRASSSPIFSNLKFQTIYNGISVSSFSYKKDSNDETILKKYGLPLDKRLVLHVTPSFSDPIKGGKYFTELSERLDSNYQCVVVGSKGYISDKIIAIPFVRNQNDLATIYRMSSVFVICSLRDNFPTVCLEANCCGTPVVGFDVGGVKETIYPGMGETVNFGELNALHSAVIKWSNTKIDENTIKKAIIRNSSVRMIDEYFTLYKKIATKL